MHPSRVGPPDQTHDPAAPAASVDTPRSSASSSSVIQMMRGKQLSEQLEALAPRESSKPGDRGLSAPTGDRSAGGAPVQMAVSLGMLEKQLSETPSYTKTIDAGTDCATANAVGDEWCGSGASRQKYGPPFGYQLLSADGKRAYRPPMVKQSGKAQGTAQANYQARSGSGGAFPFNAHVTVTDIDQYAGTGESSSSTGTPSGGSSTSTGAPNGGSSSSTTDTGN